jgi:hypothetical protein
MKSVILFLFVFIAIGVPAQDSTRLDSVENVINNIKSDHIQDSALIAERDSIIADLLLNTARELEAENNTKDKERILVTTLILVFIVLSVYNHRKKEKDGKKL